MSVLDQTLSAAGLGHEDLLIAWREACDDLRRAYRAWCFEWPAAGRDRFAAYLAAADREAAAASVLARYAAGHPAPDDLGAFGHMRVARRPGAAASGLQVNRKRAWRQS
jgi:hypothetical protein